MSKSEWPEEAEHYEQLAQEASSSGLESLAGLWETKANACREAAIYATEEDENEGV